MRRGAHGGAHEERRNLHHGLQLKGTARNWTSQFERVKCASAAAGVDLHKDEQNQSRCLLRFALSGQLALSMGLWHLWGLLHSAQSEERAELGLGEL